jgi:hypothetical protein
MQQKADVSNNSTPVQSAATVISTADLFCCGAFHANGTHGQIACLLGDEHCVLQSCTLCIERKHAKTLLSTNITAAWYAT